MVHNTPLYALPVISAPTSSPATYYPTVASKIQVTSNPPEVTITVTDLSLGSVLAIYGGEARLILAGGQLPGGTVATGDAIVLKIMPNEYNDLGRNLPSGYPIPCETVYSRIDLAEVRKAFKPMVEKLDDAVLKKFYTGQVANPTRADWVENYLDRFMAGGWGIYVRGGMPIGRGTLASPTGPVSFGFRMFGTSLEDLPVGPYFEQWPSLNGMLVGHPVAAASASLPKPTRRAHLQFLTWHQGTMQYIPLPNMNVKMLDKKMPGTVVGSGTTNQTGTVTLALPSGSPPAPVNGYFVIDTGGGNLAGRQPEKLPAQWSTETRTAADGSLGFYPNFTGFSLGSAAKPLVYYVGVDMHLELRFLVPKDQIMPNNPLPPGPPGLTRPYPPHIRVEVRGKTLGSDDRSFGEFRTDEQGQLHGVIDENELTDLYFIVHHESADPSIGLAVTAIQKGFLSVTPISWNSAFPEVQRRTGGCYFDIFKGANIGTPSAPLALTVQYHPDYGHVAAYVLSVMREVHTWLHIMSKKDWTGVPGLNINVFVDPQLEPSKQKGKIHVSISTGSPPGMNLYIESIHFGSRPTIAHEYAHQVMWKLTNVSLLRLGSFVVSGDYQTYHDGPVAASPTHAFIDGWAEFVELLFGGFVDPVFPNRNVYADMKYSNPQPLNTSPNKHGQQVEGAIAQALYEIYLDVVLNGTQVSNYSIPATPNGVWSAASPPVDFSVSAYQDKFTSVFWEPMKRLTADTLNVQEYTRQIELGNPADWPTIRSIFNKWKIDP